MIRSGEGQDGEKWGMDKRGKFGCEPNKCKQRAVVWVYVRQPCIASSSLATMASINLDEEVRLYTNNTEREKYNLLATLFGIIVALEYLERAYVRDSITAAECVL